MTAKAFPWHRPSTDDREAAAVNDVLTSGWLTTGPRTEQFESRVRDLVGVEAAFATSSCTAALHLALLACGIGAGDEVILPDITFCAAANVVVQVGATPVLADVRLEDSNIDVDHASSLVGPRTKAIIPVHYGGEPADMKRIAALASRHGLAVIEDAAHAIGSLDSDGSHVGVHSLLTAFSFYANKVITTGEGGMLVGRSDLVDRARRLGRHGIDKPVWDRAGNRGGPAYDVTVPGLKYNMSDLAAAVGLVQLDKLETFVDARRRIADHYDTCLDGASPDLQLLTADPSARSARHLYAVRFVGEVASNSRYRDEVQAFLAERGVGTSVHFIPLHRLAAHQWAAEAQLPHASAIGSQILSLPCYPGMTATDTSAVAQYVLDALRSVSREKH